MNILPAIDVIEGKCVRLAEGDFARKIVYNEDPVAVAQRFEDAGLKRLHLVDLDGARAGEVTNWRVLEAIARKTNLIIDFSGGLKADDDLRIARECGAQLLAIGSVGVKDPDSLLRWLEMYGPEVLLLSADVREGRIAVKGWEEQTELEIVPFLTDWLSHGITTAICTDIGHDGLLKGPSFQLYEQLREALPDVQLIASGGVRGIADLAMLAEAGLAGAIVGKALYEGRVRPSELADFEATTHA